VMRFSAASATRSADNPIVRTRFSSVKRS
jgi:hypothetical protein